MQKPHQPQTIDKSVGRDTAGQISGAETTGQGGKVKLVRPNVRREVKALNGTRGRGAYFVQVKLDSEWNEIRVKLTDGSTTRTESFVDLGHTTESKIDALCELRATVKHFSEL